MVSPVLSMVEIEEGAPLPAVGDHATPAIALVHDLAVDRDGQHPGRAFHHRRAGTSAERQALSGQPARQVSGRRMPPGALAGRIGAEVAALRHSPDAAEARLDAEVARGPGLVVDGDRELLAHDLRDRPPGEMSSTTSATGMPGLQVSGQLETRSRRLLSTMEKLAPGLVAPAAAMIHSPSGSMARVRSTASREGELGRPRGVGGRGRRRDAGAPGRGGVIDTRSEHRNGDGGRDRQDHQVPSWRREIAREETKPLSDRPRSARSTRSPARRSAGSRPGRPRRPARPAEPGRWRPARPARPWRACSGAWRARERRGSAGR